jgi:hypothetical protein
VDADDVGDGALAVRCPGARARERAVVDSSPGRLGEWRGESNPERRGLEGNQGPGNRALVSFDYPGSARQVPSFGHRVPKTSALSCQDPAVSLLSGRPQVSNEVCNVYRWINSVS